MIEQMEDTTGGHNLLKGRELEAWCLLLLKHDMTDALYALGLVTDSPFTWRGRWGQRLEPSRLDRIYLGEKGWWLGSLKELIHEGGQALSDHDPVILRAALDPAPSTTPARYYTYFKASPAVLKIPANMVSLQQAWESGPGGEPCPHRRWEAACRRLKAKYIHLQNAPKFDAERCRRVFFPCG
ncbi:unnamed protein product [Calypogeia fissa]